MTRIAPRLPSISCPHCGESAFARSDGKTTETYRELYYHCRNSLACGHIFIVAMSVTRTIAPSRIPNPAVMLPVAPPEWTPANDDRVAANDNQNKRKVE